ncbi:unnamed protein product [Protopolystoma xenopodis]|uniref:Uncharacterized protein n=1 Tax=Protopolystoma xenopodis TaxID=117903 RepID=A0A448X3B8_9PLAT|nr:unnamed protein product [Protopolystoma xenopodis]
MASASDPAHVVTIVPCAGGCGQYLHPECAPKPAITNDISGLSIRLPTEAPGQIDTNEGSTNHIKDICAVKCATCLVGLRVCYICQVSQRKIVASLGLTPESAVDNFRIGPY